MTAWQAVLIVEGYMKGNGWKKSMASHASVQILDGLSDVLELLSFFF